MTRIELETAGSVWKLLVAEGDVVGWPLVRQSRVSILIRYGVLKKGQDKSLINIEAVNLRDFSDKNGYVDDKPYGGGAGMVLQAQPLIDATRYVKSKLKNFKCIYLSPKGTKVTQEMIVNTADNDNLRAVTKEWIKDSLT